MNHLFNLSTLIMTYQYSENLPAPARERYFSKLALVGLDKCPYKLPADVWIDDMKSWPDVQYPDIYHYLINFPRVYSPDAMMNYKSLESYRFFVAGWVGIVLHVITDLSNYIFRADVRPSYRINDEPHHPWVSVKKTGCVIAAHCDCMAGLGETCSHIGALLFKIERLVSKGWTTSACTDKPCTWNQCQREVTPAPVSQIRFYPSSSQKCRTNTKRTYPEPSEEEKDEFLSALASVPRKIVGLSAFSKFNAPFRTRALSTSKQLPKPLRDYFLAEKQNLTGLSLDTYCGELKDRMHVTDAQATYVREVTLAQSSSVHWHQQRAGRITSSVAHSVVKSSPTSPAPSLLRKLTMVNVQPIRAPALLWGREHEEDAFSVYEHVVCSVPFRAGAHHTDLSGDVLTTNLGTHEDIGVRRVGLCLSTKHPFLGSSPDGIIECKCHGKGVLEIKCPYKHKDSDIKTATADKNFCLDASLTLKKDHPYYTQVQHQMFVCDTHYCDFVVWTNVDCVIGRIQRDEVFINDMFAKLQTFWMKAVLPELVTRALEAGSCATEVTKTAHDRTDYCICKSGVEDDPEPMVGCDKCDDWFHLSCLKLKRAPSAKRWYCPSCRKDMKSA